jgi:hypothetical protein
VIDIDGIRDVLLLLLVNWDCKRGDDVAVVEGDDLIGWIIIEGICCCCLGGEGDGGGC